MTKVTYKKLRKFWGKASEYYNEIELYNKLEGKKHLEILIHEKLHLCFPELDESAIKKHSKALCVTLWGDGYRKL
jgi:hypothetical protein